MRLLSLLSLGIFFSSTAVAADKKIGPEDITMVPLQGEVNDESVAPLIEAVTKGLTIIVINSPGGSVSSALALIKTMEMSKYPTACLVDGLAASAAAVIFVNCQYRVFLRTSILMFHDVSVVLPADTSLNKEALRELSEEVRVLNTSLEARICTHTNLPWADCIKKIKEDWWLSWEDVQKFGIADQIQ